MTGHYRWKCARWREYSRTRDDSIRGGDGRDDIFDNSLRQRPSNSLDLELSSATGCFVKQPVDMLGIVRIHLLV